jgi:hypothetical protein
MMDEGCGPGSNELHLTKDDVCRAVPALRIFATVRLVHRKALQASSGNQHHHVKIRCRIRRQRHCSKTPASRIGLLPVLFAYGLLLGGSPAGQAGFLWLHLATAHHEVPHASSVERRHDHDSTHPHPSEHHEHDRHEEDASRSIANAPHEHDGVVHTHEPRPDKDPVLLSAAASEYYLSPTVTPIPLPARYGSRTPWMVPSPDQVTPLVETPPPRLPG